MRLPITTQPGLLEPDPLLDLDDTVLEEILEKTGVPLRDRIVPSRVKKAINELAWPNLTDSFPVSYPAERLELLERTLATIGDYLQDERNHREYDNPPPSANPLFDWKTEAEAWLAATREERIGRPPNAWAAQFDVRTLGLFAAAFDIGDIPPPLTYAQPGNSGNGPTVRFFEAVLSALQCRASELKLIPIDRAHQPDLSDVSAARKIRILSSIQFLPTSPAISSRVKKARELRSWRHDRPTAEESVYRRFQRQFSEKLCQME